MAQVEVQLADEVFQHHVLVVGGLSAEVILELDFMEENNCTIELGKMLYFLDRKKSIALDGVDRQIGTTQPIKVSIGETVHLLACSEMEMMANASHTGEAGVWMVEETTDKRSPIMVARAIVEPRGGEVPVRLLNPTDQPVTLHKGTQIATLDMVEAPTDREVGKVQAHPEQGSVGKEEMLEQMVRLLERDLTETQREQLLNLLKRYSDIFAENRQDVGRMDKVTHRISTGISPPIHQPVRRVPPAKREDTRKLLQGMLIRPSSSPWASPIVLVKKKDMVAQDFV